MGALSTRSILQTHFWTDTKVVDKTYAWEITACNADIDTNEDHYDVSEAFGTMKQNSLWKRILLKWYYLNEYKQSSQTNCIRIKAFIRIRLLITLEYILKIYMYVHIYVCIYCLNTHACFILLWSFYELFLKTTVPKQQTNKSL